MANPTIGRVKCPLMNEWAEVRKYSKGTKKLYYVSSAGMITPNSAAGQNWMLENAEIWGEGVAPSFDEKPVNEKKASVKPVNDKPKKRSLLEMIMSEDDD